MSEDGAIFISIDDHEAANLKKVCDEVFGAGNFIAEFPRITKKKEGNQQTNMLGIMIIFYAIPAM